MPQTLLAIGALAISITFALSSQRAEIRVDQQRIHGEMQVLAGQVAVDMLAHIGAQEYDEVTKTMTVEDETLLTPAPFATGKAFAICDDVDDFHEMAPYQRDVVVGSTITMDITASVRYVDTSGQPSLTQTFQKEVTVSVQDAPRPGGARLLTQPIVISEIITYP